MPQFARVSVFLDNGKVVDFECSSFNDSMMSFDKDGKLTKLTPGKKDNGLSLMFCKTEHVVAIVRDTSKNED